MMTVIGQKRFFRDEQGVAAVEFALIVPMLALIMMGIIDYGTFINEKMKLQDLARTATQYVVQGGSSDDLQANVIATSDFYSESAAGGQTITVTTATACECANGASISCSSTCPTPGDYMRHFYSTTLSSTYAPIFVYPGISDSLELQGYSRMQYDP